MVVSDANTSIEDLRLAHKTGDSDRTGRGAHKLKGLFAQFGAADATRGAVAVEDGIDGNAAVEGFSLAGEDVVQRIGAIDR